MNFSKFSIGVETTLDKLHFISWSQTQNYHFLVAIVSNSTIII